MLTIVAAVAKNKVIGCSKTGQMPWNIPEELEHFKRVTMYRPVLMGRKTAETIPKKLIKRDCILLSTDRRAKKDGWVTYTLEKILEVNEEHFGFEQEFMICGGKEIYEKSMPYCSVGIISRLNIEADGDILMPDFDENWDIRHTEEYEKFTVEFWFNKNRKIFKHNSK